MEKLLVDVTKDFLTNDSLLSFQFLLTFNIIFSRCPKYFNDDKGESNL